MRPAKLYAKPYYGEHPVPPPYRIWQHRAWVDASGVVVAEEVDAGDSAVSSPYPGEIRGSVLGFKESQLAKQGFQQITDPLYVTMRAELAEEDADKNKSGECDRLRKIARQMFSCLSLRDLYYAQMPLDGDVMDVYTAWLKEFGTPDRIEHVSGLSVVRDEVIEIARSFVASLDIPNSNIRTIGHRIEMDVLRDAADDAYLKLLDAGALDVRRNFDDSGGQVIITFGIERLWQQAHAAVEYKSLEDSAAWTLYDQGQDYSAEED